MKLGTAPAKVAAPKSQPVKLPYDRAVASGDGAKSDPGFDAEGHAMPAEMLPGEIDFAGIRFQLATAGKPNAVVARGQTIPLPTGKFTRLYLLAASADGDQKAAFRLGEKPVELTIQHWTGAIGQWDNREWKQSQDKPWTTLEFTGRITPGFIKRAPVAWFASHRHTANGANEPYAYSYLFAYPIDLPPNAGTLTLPDKDKLRLLAVTVSDEPGPVHPAQPLYDTLERRGR